MKRIASIIALLSALTASADYVRQATETYPGGGGGGSPNAVTTNEEGVVEAPLGLTGAYVNNNWFFWFLGGSSVWLYQPTDLHIGGDDYSDGTPLPDYIDARIGSMASEKKVPVKTAEYGDRTTTEDLVVMNTLQVGHATSDVYVAHGDIYKCNEKIVYGLTTDGTTYQHGNVDISGMTNGLLRASDYHGDYISDGTNTMKANREWFYSFVTNVLVHGDFIGSDGSVFIYDKSRSTVSEYGNDILQYYVWDHGGWGEVYGGDGVLILDEHGIAGVDQKITLHYTGEWHYLEYESLDKLSYTFPTYMNLTFTREFYRENRDVTVSEKTRLATTNDIPTALKNPHALTFTGDSAITYDGSEPHTVNIPSTPEEVGAYPKADGESDHTKVTNLLTYVGGQNVRVSVTNYYGNTSGNLPRLRIEEFTTVTNSGVEVQAWNTVWDEDDKFIEFATNINESVSSMTNASLNALTSITNDIVNYADATKAPKAWGTYASDGTLAPSDTVVHATSKTMFGAEFKVFTVGANQVGFLIARNAAGYSGAEPGEFKFYNLSGNHFFGMHIRDEVELGCATDGILITNVGGDNMATLTYNVTMSGKPSIHYTPTLDTKPIVWEKLSQRDGTQVPGASKAVTWEAVTTPGTEVCHINMGSAPKGFYYATIDDPAESWLHTDLVLNAQGGILCTNEFTGLTVNVVPYIDDASNTVKWRVKP